MMRYLVGTLITVGLLFGLWGMSNHAQTGVANTLSLIITAQNTPQGQPPAARPQGYGPAVLTLPPGNAPVQTPAFRATPPAEQIVSAIVYLQPLEPTANYPMRVVNSLRQRLDVRRALAAPPINAQIISTIRNVDRAYIINVAAGRLDLIRQLPGVRAVLRDRSIPLNNPNEVGPVVTQELNVEEGE
jgi:hypothetical protein